MGWWTFDGKDMTGNIAYDRAGNQVNGTLTNGPLHTIGKIGQALNFDNNFVDTGAETTLDDIRPASYSAWIKPDNSGGSSQGRILHKGALFFSLDNTNVVDGINFTYTGVGPDVIARVANVITYFQWQHVAVVWDGSVTGSNVRIYVNGVLRSLTSSTDANTLDSDASDNLLIGSNNGTRDFNGAIDDVRIYNRMLSADEIKRLYKMGNTLRQGVASSNGSLSTGLVGYWSFNGNDVAGNRANDLSGRGNHGTLTDDISQLTRPERAIGKIGQALNFDGVDDLVDIESNMDVNGSGITLAAWVKPESLTNDFRIISKSNGTQAGAHMWMLSNCSVSGCGGTNELRARINISGDTWTFFATNLFFEKDVWQFVAVTYDGDAVRFFKNGVSEVQDAENGTVDTDGTMNVYIGANHDGGGAGGNPFPGLIDEVRVYERALSVDELKRLYNMGR